MTLEVITADSLAPIRHGFFSRKGGASSGIFSGLNFGPGSSDQSEAVTMNRARVAQAMQVAPNHLLTLHQVHSATVHIVTDPFAPGSVKADAMVTSVKGLALGALSADCQAVLFADIRAGVIGATHAGWKGALFGVLDATLEAMEKLGARRTDTIAVIGPCISQRAYEVGPEFLETFLAENQDYSRFFANGTGDRYMFDLPSFGLHRLRVAGVASADWTGHCTYTDPDMFFSYRRSVHQNEADYGRLISAISL